MVFSPNFSDFSSLIQISWKKTKINLVSKYFRIYLTEQVGYCVFISFSVSINFHLMQLFLLTSVPIIFTQECKRKRQLFAVS